MCGGVVKTIITQSKTLSYTELLLMVMREKNCSTQFLMEKLLMVIREKNCSTQFFPLWEKRREIE